METLNAQVLKPICALPDKRAKPRKVAQNPSFPFFKSSNSSANNNGTPQNQREGLAKNVQNTLAFLASAFNAKIASALTYEEALEQTVNSNSAADFDAGSVVETIVTNPLLIAGGVALIAVPLVLSQVLGSKPKPFGVESAKSAYAKLADDPNAQLLDIRSPKEVREVGSPDIRGLKKKPVSVVYKGEDKPGFLQKLALRFKNPETTTLYILDKFDGSSELVAELATANGFKSAYAIKDGSEGPRGWLNSRLPWIQPAKSFNFDFSGLAELFEDGADAFPVTLAVAAAAGLGVLVFTEVETVLQLLGSAALVQVFSKKLLFAEERKQTLKQIDEFLTTKIAPKELIADIKQIGTALLPVTVNNRALPAPKAAAPEVAVAEDTALKSEAPPEIVDAEDTVLKSEAAPEAAAAEDTVLKSEAAPEPEAAAQPASESPSEAAAAAAPVINSTLQSEVKASSHQRALSPFAAYEDFKPPSSPCPSPP